MNDLRLPYSYKHLSLDDIMDDNNTHTYISDHALIDPNQLVMPENLLQVVVISS